MIKLENIRYYENEKNTLPELVTVCFLDTILDHIPNIYEFSSLEEIHIAARPHINLVDFVHNETGPAYIVNNKGNHYFINGKQLKEEEFKKYLHDKKFSDKLNLIIE